MEMGGWLGGTILYFFPNAIQLACVNCPVFKVKNNIGKLVFWRDVSYSPYLNFFVVFYIRPIKLMGLVLAICSNSPLPQVSEATTLSSF